MNQDVPLAGCVSDRHRTGLGRPQTDHGRRAGLRCFGLTKVVPPFDAVTSPSLLGEVGESFTLRGAFDSAKPEVVQAKVTEVAAKVKTSDASHPLADPATLVMLEIHYDGKPIPLEFRNGKAFVTEPQEGQKVMLILRRTEHAKGRLGVVVKVNGENTLNRQRLRDIDCRKWVLDPGATQSVEDCVPTQRVGTSRKGPTPKNRGVHAAPLRNHGQWAA